GRPARRARGRAGPRRQAGLEGRRVRGARRRPGLRRAFPPLRARLRVVLAVPRPDRPGRRGPGRPGDVVIPTTWATRRATPRSNGIAMISRATAVASVLASGWL